MKHATVNKDGYNVPLIGVAEEAVLEECDCCHEQHALLDLTWTGTQTLCAKCADQQKEESARETWLESLATTCQADDKPCEGCQQGGMCDGSPNTGTHRREAAAGDVEMQTCAESAASRSVQ